MLSINTVCDYIILSLKTDDPNASLQNLKLQKLLYYCQAWHLAFYDSELFEGDFQAWVHGPVNREIFDRFRDDKTIYSEINTTDVQDSSCCEKLETNSRIHIKTILEYYVPYSATQLEEMTHSEDPWQEARRGYSPMERCERVISKETMRDYYKRRLQHA